MTTTSEMRAGSPTTSKNIKTESVLSKISKSLLKRTELIKVLLDKKEYNQEHDYVGRVDPYTHNSREWGISDYDETSIVDEKLRLTHRKLKESEKQVKKMKILLYKQTKLIEKLSDKLCQEIHKPGSSEFFKIKENFEKNQKNQKKLSTKQD